MILTKYRKKEFPRKSQVRREFCERTATAYDSHTAIIHTHTHTHVYIYALPHAPKKTLSDRVSSRGNPEGHFPHSVREIIHIRGDVGEKLIKLFP